MQRREFFKKLGIGVGVVGVAPTILSGVVPAKPDKFDQKKYDEVWRRKLKEFKTEQEFKDMFGVRVKTYSHTKGFKIHMIEHPLLSKESRK